MAMDIQDEPPYDTLIKEKEESYMGLYLLLLTKMCSLTVNNKKLELSFVYHQKIGTPTMQNLTYTDLIYLISSTFHFKHIHFAKLPFVIFYIIISLLNYA